MTGTAVPLVCWATGAAREVAQRQVYVRPNCRRALNARLSWRALPAGQHSGVRGNGMTVLSFGKVPRPGQLQLAGDHPGQGNKHRRKQGGSSGLKAAWT